MIDLKIYKTEDGKAPFSKWFSSLPVNQAIRVDEALRRMELGNFGDHKSVGEGVMERRIFSSPALRIYYALDGRKVVVLLAGGGNQKQRKDIEQARRFWAEYKARKNKRT